MSRINSKMDPVHISQATYDANTEAVRVVLSPTEHSLEIRAEDGDSILTQKTMQVLEVTAGQLIDTSKAAKMSILSDSAVTVTVVAAGKEKNLGTVGLTPVAVCAPAVKISADCVLILQS